MTPPISPQIPSMLRDELIHPAVTHFPIAFFALAGFLALVGLFTRRFDGVLLFILTLGVAGGWIAILTGGWAEDVVNRLICDPTVTHEHERWAEYTVWSSSFAWLVLSLARFFKSTPRWLVSVALVVTVLSAGAVLYTGHLGATLVYQQGAAVYKPGPQCSEYE